MYALLLLLVRPSRTWDTCGGPGVPSPLGSDMLQEDVASWSFLWSVRRASSLGQAVGDPWHGQAQRKPQLPSSCLPLPACWPPQSWPPLGLQAPAFLARPPAERGDLRSLGGLSSLAEPMLMWALPTCASATASSCRGWALGQPRGEVRRGTGEGAMAETWP